MKTRQGKKGGTQHQKNHRWESFTTKISKLSSLDPIRRVRRHDAGDSPTATSDFSYFRTGLEKWQELNLSAAFISFTQEVQPLCDSLAQVVHFETKIMELIATYLEKRERESLEPLLELMTDFAHDLGIRFEHHYERALGLVTSIAGTFPDVAVIEWSFTCLAFLFKYLSKLLVPDLRATYDSIAPLLGKRRQPPHIARFAAEAMSFLIKKAGAPAHREKALVLIVQHVRNDLLSIVGTKEYNLYYHGVMTLFAEAMKGNGLTVHTSGSAIFQSLVQVLEAEDFGSKELSPWQEVISGVLTSILHHTGPDTVKELLEVILFQANASVDSFVESKSKIDLRRLLVSSRSIGIMAGVRKGSRIADWPAILKTMSKIITSISKNAQIVEKHENDSDLFRYVILSVAIVMQYSPMDAMIPFISPFMDSLTKDPLARCFFTFCSYFSEADAERFKTISLPYFQRFVSNNSTQNYLMTNLTRFVVAHWSEDNGDALCVLLPNMVFSGVLPSNYAKKGFALPQSWQDQIVSKFERLEVSPFPEQASPALHDRSPATWHDRCLPKYNALLDVLECTSVHPSTNARIAEILLRKLKLALRPSSSLAPEEANFIVGRGFSAFSRMSKGAAVVDKALKPLLRAAAPRYSRLPKFLEALLEYERSLASSPAPDKKASSDPDMDVDGDLLVNSLISNLSTGSQELRLLSLRLLEHIYNAENETPSKALTIMIMVEQTRLDLQTVRASSMHIRNLATLFSAEPADSWVKQAIPAFCFGMLTVKFAQIWEDATETLKQISMSKAGEEPVAKLAFDWLETPSLVGYGISGPTDHSQGGMTDFECSNLRDLEKLANNSQSNVQMSRGTMLNNFAQAQEPVPARPNTARTQALRVLTAIPLVAEKRSRQLVPMFLSWTSKPGADVEDTEGEEQNLSDWTRKDQKAQLQLFALFTNSVSLFRSEEVYSAILQLLANGDIEIQKAALTAIFTWKNASIKPYQENLLNLLDEARFKDEISVLLQGETLVQSEHQAGLKPVLLRLLYGRAISRKGAASGKQGMEAKRLTVLRNLSVEDVAAYLEIALGELAGVQLIQNGAVQESALLKAILSPRKLVGVINMVEGVLKELGTKATPFAGTLADAALYCAIYASRQLRDEADDDDDEPAALSSQTSLLKVIRKTAIKCLILLFANAADFDWSQYVSSIDKEIVSPRLENLPIETAQGISGILRLFFTWSTSAKTVLLLGENAQVLPKIAECVIPDKSKDEVKLMALEVIRNVIKIAKESADNGDVEVAESVKAKLLAPHMDSFLLRIGEVLRGHHDISKDILEACVSTVSELSPFVTTSTQARNLVDVSIFLLDQPLRRVNPRTKGELLRVLEVFVPLYDLQNDIELKDRVYNTITSLFGFFTDNPSRQVLPRVLTVFSEKEHVLKEVAEICMDLNSFDTSRLDSPDFDRRLAGFKAIRTSRDISFTSRQWRPLLFNMLYYIRDAEDLGILSSNSSDGLCSFIDTASKATGEIEISAFKVMLLTILLPAIFSGAKEQSEVVRREYAKVMAHLVRSFPEWEEVNDMHSLLAGEDELESSFFNNILTVGKGRQSSALGLVSAAAERGELRAKNVSHFFIPLIEHFILDRAEGADAHNLASEATATVGILAGSLEWPQYRAVLLRYTGYVKAKPEIEKQLIRVVGRIIDALALAAIRYTEEEEVEGENTMDAVIDAVPEKQSTLSRTIPKKLKLADDLTTNIIPPLLKYLHGKDESTVSLRVPVAVLIVKLLKLLPRDQMKQGLPAVITDICHILRSKAQESRDMTRDTLIQICVLLGPSCFDFILRELRGALKQGPQLHVVSYTMHSMLVATTPEYSPGDLDYCVPTIVDIIMNDIFGATGQEKEADEYVSKMKEVKSSMSHDSMELIAKTTTISQLIVLVQPIKELLKNKLNLHAVHKIDDLLKRIEKGLLRNSAVHSRDSLIFCYQTIKDVYEDRENEENGKREKRGKPVDRRLLQKGAKKSGERSSSTTVYTYKLVRFAFDLMSTVLKKYDDLRTASNITNLLPIIKNALLEGEEEVKISAFRLLATIIKVYKVEENGTLTMMTSDYRTVKVSPENSKIWTELYRVAANEAKKCVLGSAISTNIFQESLKLLSVVFRNRPLVEIKKGTIDSLLGSIKEHLTQPEYRHITFSFLRAVIDTKIQSAEVYDTLDHVGNVMVQNYDEETRRLAREAFFQFLSRYEQEQKRWKEQLDFVVANLKYPREGGRSSILDLILLLLAKTSDEYVRQVSERCFIPLIILLAEDESKNCRNEAAVVLKEIFKRAKGEQLESHLEYLRNWVSGPKDEGYVHIKLQVYALYYETHSDNDSDVSMLQKIILEVLQTADAPKPDSEHVLSALQLSIVLVKTFPKIFFSPKSKNLWEAIRICLSYPDSDATAEPDVNLSSEVKTAATVLVSGYFSDFATQASNTESSLQKLPLKGSGGLRLTAEDITDFVRRSAYMFKKGILTTELATEVVKNLVFLGSLASENNLKWHGQQTEEDEDEDAKSEEEKKTLLGYLIERLSFVLRKETSPPRAPGLIPKTASLQILTHLTAHLSAETLTTYLPTILLPLHNITDPSIPIPYSTDSTFRETYEGLKTSSDEVMENLKRKVGTETYTKNLLKVREGVRERRMRRSGKRKIEAVSAPEKFGEVKRKKGERKKERRKEKGREFRDMRHET